MLQQVGDLQRQEVRRLTSWRGRWRCWKAEKQEFGKKSPIHLLFESSEDASKKLV